MEKNLYLRAFSLKNNTVIQIFLTHLVLCINQMREANVFVHSLLPGILQFFAIRSI